MPSFSSQVLRQDHAHMSAACKGNTSLSSAKIGSVSVIAVLDQIAERTDLNADYTRYY